MDRTSQTRFVKLDSPGRISRTQGF
jgi:hypothetical protein